MGHIRMPCARHRPGIVNAHTTMQGTPNKMGPHLASLMPLPYCIPLPCPRPQYGTPAATWLGTKPSQAQVHIHRD